MAFKSRVMAKLGKIDSTQDASFDGLQSHYLAIKEYAKKQHKDMHDFLAKTRAFCYATIASSESFSQFFRSSSFEHADVSPRRPVCISLHRGKDGFGMMIELDGTVRSIRSLSCLSLPTEAPWHCRWTDRPRTALPTAGRLTGSSTGIGQVSSFATEGGPAQAAGVPLGSQVPALSPDR